MMLSITKDQRNASRNYRAVGARFGRRTDTGIGTAESLRGPPETVTALLIHCGRSRVAKSCLCNPVDCRPPGSSVQGILQTRILEWVPISFSRGLSPPRDRTLVSCTGRQILYPGASGEAVLQYEMKNLKKKQQQPTMRYHLTLVRMAIIKKSMRNKCWRGCGEKGALLHCGCGVEIGAATKEKSVEVP